MEIESYVAIMQFDSVHMLLRGQRYSSAADENAVPPKIVLVFHGIAKILWSAGAEQSVASN